MLKIAAIVAVFLALLPRPGFCGWQYTQWGMTPEQVKSASRGSAADNPTVATQSTRSSEALLVSPHSAGTFQFKVYFLFDRRTRKLDRVSMELVEPARGMELYTQLVGQLGRPASQEVTALERVARWLDTRNRNVIVWTTTANINVRLQYTELAGGGRNL